MVFIPYLGGWSFNDPGPTQSTFSQLAGSESAQQAFFASLLTFLSQYGFDGVDIDW
jgi:chitinase